MRHTKLPSKKQNYWDRAEYWEESWGDEETWCYSDSNEKSSANTGEKNTQRE